MNKLLRKDGQGTAEYAILIALVVAAIIAMQVYAQRSIQARVRDTSTFITNVGVEDGIFQGTRQYEPYYQNSSFDVDREGEEKRFLSASKEGVGRSANTTTLRKAGGFQESTYEDGGAGKDDTATKAIGGASGNAGEPTGNAGDPTGDAGSGG